MVYRRVGDNDRRSDCIFLSVENQSCEIKRILILYIATLLRLTHRLIVLKCSRSVQEEVMLSNNVKTAVADTEEDESERVDHICVYHPMRKSDENDYCVS